MASNLERVGVLLVAEGISQFTSMMADAAKAVVGFIGDSIDLAGDFEQTMNVLQATSGATADEMGAVADKAKALGADLTLPATSAVDAGEAMLELSKAGFTTQQAMDAAKGVLQLSAAAQIDNAKAAEIAANAINAFGLSATDATFVSDLLAASANASSVEITDVADSYKMAGAVFANFQGPVVGSKQAMIDLTTAVGLLGNAGIKGSDAGTSLKQALLQLTGPSKKAKGLMIELARSIGESGDIAYDAQGKMRSFPEILGLVSRATKDLTDEKRNQYITDIFGADASRAILILMKQGPDAWAKMEAAVTKEGAASALAAAQTKGYKGALEGVKSQIETLQLTIGEKFLPILANLLTNYISPGIAALNNFTNALFGDKEAFELLSTPIQNVARWISSAVAAFGYWEKGVISTRTALDVLIPGLGDKFGPAIDIAIQKVGEVATWLQTNLPAAIQTASGFWTTTLQPAINDAAAFFTSTLIPAISEGAAWLQTRLPGAMAVATQLIGGYVDALKGRWEVLQGAIANVVNGVVAVVTPAFALIQRFLTEHGAEITTVITTAWNSINTIINTVIQILGIAINAFLTGVGGWITKHGDQIYLVMSTAWNLIASVITTTLNLIQGVVTFVLQAISGDWGKAHDTLLNTSTDFVKNLWNLFSNAMELIAAFFGTSMTEIARVWQGNWDMMVSIVAKVVDRVANVGSAIVNAISSGFSRAWDGFVADAKAKLAEFTDMLPFSEPKDTSSPLYGLGESGESIIKMIQDGINAAPALTIGPTAIAEAVAAIGDQVRKGIGKKKKAPDLGTLIPDTKSAIPDTIAGIWQALLATDPSDVQRINDLTAAYEKMAAAEVFVSPPASAAQIAAGGTSSTTNVTYNNNMPVYTNMSTAAIEQSMAIIAASMP